MNSQLLTGMRKRVRCTACEAHRDLTTHPRCPICRAFRYTVVAPTRGDLEAAEERVTKELLECAELVDTAIHDRVQLDPEHPIAVRLASACRERAYLLAGLLVSGKEPV